jgi:hypothetical protein
MKTVKYSRPLTLSRHTFSKVQKKQFSKKQQKKNEDGEILEASDSIKAHILISPKKSDIV